MKAKFVSLVSLVVVAVVIGLNAGWWVELNSQFSGKLWLLVVVLGLLGMIAIGEVRRQPDYRRPLPPEGPEVDGVSVKSETKKTMTTIQTRATRPRKIGSYAAVICVVLFSLSSVQMLRGSAASLELEEALYQAEVVGDKGELCAWWRYFLSGRAE
ncbi:MAG: hypothetical protein LR015_08100 [Verrucomicrobia bacterium]|nr:hypothetical protein [Verrucomicrobiota bacterium]